MKNLFEKYKIPIKLLIAHSIGVVISCIIYFFLIPIILNYPKGTYGTEFQWELEHANYLIQVLEIGGAIFGIFAIVSLINTRFLIKYHDLFINCENYSQDDINYVRNKLFTTPYIILMLDIVISSIALTVIHALSINQLGITTVKLFILVLTLITVLVAYIFIYICNLFRGLLAKLPYSDNINLKKTMIKKRVFYNILPVTTVSILFTSILGFSIVSIKTGDSLFQIYHSQLNSFKEYNNFSSVQELLEKSKNLNLLSDNDFVFIKTEDNEYYNSSGENIELSKFFDKYLNEFSAQNNGRCYEYYGIDCQGATINIIIDGKNYVLGIYYYIISAKILIYFVISFVILMAINIVILLLFSKNLSNDINIISNSFLNIAKDNKVKNIRQLPITSNDEFSNLIIAFNKIQKLTDEYILDIEQKKDLIVRQEKLSILGELAGGMAHDINNPASAINMSINVLYNIEDKNQKKEILDNMKECINRILTIVSSVRDQFRNMGENKKTQFNLSEVLKNIEVVIHNQLVKYKCTLNIVYSKDFEIYGEKNKLNQVLSNIIMNSILAYHEKNITGEINVDISSDEEYNIISIQDKAYGIPEKICNNLFTKIITTRGTQGTGLGLYLAKSIIEDEFNGKIYFETETGVGTTFYIKLRKNQK